jgi:hypothetical protein
MFFDVTAYGREDARGLGEMRLYSALFAELATLG